MSATVQSSWKNKIKDSVEIPILTRCCFCVPLRRGLISFAYINLTLTLMVICMLSYYISFLRYQTHNETDFPPRLIADVAALVLETLMTVMFIVALHLKHVTMMKVYLHFEIIFSILGFIYSVAMMTRETASEMFLILFQLILQIYLAILINSSIVKMERDGTVKYTRDRSTTVPV